MPNQTYTAVEVGAVEAQYFEKGVLEAPDNMVWVCGVCGKTSRTRYGFNENEENVCDSGWDASCVLNAVLCYKLGQEPAQS